MIADTVIYIVFDKREIAMICQWMETISLLSHKKSKTFVFVLVMLKDHSKVGLGEYDIVPGIEPRLNVFSVLLFKFFFFLKV